MSSQLAGSVGLKIFQDLLLHLGQNLAVLTQREVISLATSTLPEITSMLRIMADAKLKAIAADAGLDPASAADSPQASNPSTEVK